MKYIILFSTMFAIFFLNVAGCTTSDKKTSYKKNQKDEVLLFIENKCKGLDDDNGEKDICQLNEAVEYCLAHRSSKSDICYRAKETSGYMDAENYNDSFLNDSNPTLTDKELDVLIHRKCKSFYKEDKFHKCIDDNLSMYCKNNFLNASRKCKSKKS